MNTFSRLLILFPLVIVLTCRMGLTQQVHTYVDRDSVKAGDLLRYTLVLEREEGQQLLSAPGEDSFQTSIFHLLEREHHRIGTRRDSLVYTLQFFGVQDTRIPRIEIELLHGDDNTLLVYSTPVPLFFESLLEDGAQEYRPLKPIFAFAATRWPWILLFLLAILTVYGIYRYMNRDQKVPSVTSPPKERPPFADPLDSLKYHLNRLSEQQERLTIETLDPFYVELGDSIRSYLKRVYGIMALEMTSTEILTALREHSADQELLQSCRRVLAEADMVKFARFNPGINETQEALDAGYQFLHTAARIDRPIIEKMRKFYEEASEENNESQVTA